MLKKTKFSVILTVIVLTIFILGTTASAAQQFRITYRINGQEVQTIRTNNIFDTLRFTIRINNGRITVENPQDSTPKPPKSQPIPEPKKPQEPTPEPPKPPVNGDNRLNQDEVRMLELVNEERKNRGIAPLKMDFDLVKLARMKSQDMIDNNYFSHTSPTYGSPFQMMRNHGIQYRHAGENLAGSFNVDRAHTSLMNSPGHRRNILNPNYTHIGIGIVDGGRYGKMYTQLFVSY